jgi:hypothetical protein
MNYYYLTKESSGIILNKASGYDNWDKLVAAVKRADAPGGVRYVAIPTRCIMRLLGKDAFVALENSSPYYKGQWKLPWPGN